MCGRNDDGLHFLTKAERALLQFASRRFFRCAWRNQARDGHWSRRMYSHDHGVLTTRTVFGDYFRCAL